MPSKKLIYLIAGIGGAALLLFNWPIIKSDSRFNPLAGGQDSKNQKLTQEAQQEARKDSDQDGLKDWEETLWKTDPQNPDSDNDGTPDGEEIKQNRDPSKPGPDDKLPDLGVRLPSEIAGPNPQDYGATNLTGQIAKTLGFQAFSGAKNKDFTVPADSELLDAATENTITGFTASFYPRISENELIIVENNEKNITEYLRLFSEIMAKNLLPTQSQEEVFLQAVQDKNFSGSEIWINYFQETTKKLKTAPTPKIAAANHQRIIELLLAKIKVLENLKEIERDPLKTMIAFQEHEKINEEIMQTMKNFENLFNASQ
ncbi:MAG: thrombospondin type 3 repeat-containing protein [Patescibacteria group bacterium]